MFNAKSLFLIALAGFTALSEAAGGKPKGPKNFIMVIPDGFGPVSETMARDYVHWTNNNTVSLPIDDMVIGQVRTKATDSYVTDSAAAATAYSCGIKSYNGAIAVNDDYEPCGTVLEAAHLKGMKTGLIVTSRITHATPASYVAHIYDRDLEANIALQEIGYGHPLGRTVDILMGGGRCFFMPNTTETSCRDDSINGLAIAKKMGYNVFTNRKNFDKKQKLPYMGLFADDHMAYEIDRDPAVEPSLKEMAIKGLNDLHAATKDSKQGFFVMVEASRIDHAGHANDPLGHLHDILAYNEAMLAMREWIDKHEEDSPTVLISTADHECGGLTVGVEVDGAPEYWFDPKYFKNGKATPGVLSKAWKAHTGPNQKAFLKSEIFGKYGINKATPEEMDMAVSLKDKTLDFELFIAKALSDRLGVSWSTGGHTASDVTLYGWGINSEKLAGQHENIEVGRFAAEQLGLDFDSATRKLQRNQTWQDEWVKPKIVGGKKVARRSLALHHH